jgi:hypothetical protein
MELAVDHVDVPVEDKGFLVLPAGLLRHPGRLLRPRGQQQDEWNGRGDDLGSHRSVSYARWKKSLSGARYEGDGGPEIAYRIERFGK